MARCGSDSTAGHRTLFYGSLIGSTSHYTGQTLQNILRPENSFELGLFWRGRVSSVNFIAEQGFILRACTRIGQISTLRQRAVAYRRLEDWQIDAGVDRAGKACGYLCAIPAKDVMRVAWPTKPDMVQLREAGWVDNAALP